MDDLLDFLRRTQLKGGVFLDAEFSAPWCVLSQMTPDDCSTFIPHAAKLIAYHYVTGDG